MIWLHSGPKHFKSLQNVHELYLTDIEKAELIYCNCLMKPKNARHPKIPILGQVAVLLSGNFFAPSNKSKNNIWLNISVESLKILQENTRLL